MFRVLRQHELRFVLAACAVFLLCAGTAAAQTQTAQVLPGPKLPASGAAVTAVSVRPVKFRVGQPCPANPSIFATIRANGATTVTYQWHGSGGKSWPQRNVKFSAAGPQSVSTNWKLGAPGEKVDEWIQLQILSPNRMTSNKVTLEFTCAAGRKK